MTSRITRRAWLGGTLALPLLRAWPLGAQAGSLVPLRSATGHAIGVDGHAIEDVTLSRQWSGETCRSRITNRSARPIAIKEVVLFDLALDLPPATPIYTTPS